jgi:hypothetical protein
MKKKLLGITFILVAVSLASRPASASLECAHSCIEANGNCFTWCGGCPYEVVGTCVNYDGCYWIQCSCHPELC